MRHFNASLVWLLLYVFVPSCCLLTTCYWPDHEAADDEVPCDPSAAVSVCCPETWTCLTNGICAAPPNGSEVVTYGRHACTDQTWDSPSCPQFCITVNMEGGAIVYQCVGQNNWCCDIGLDYDGCCTNSANFLNLGPVTASTLIGTAITTTTTSSSISTSSSSSSIPASAAASSTATTASPTVTSTANTTSNHDVAIGVGVAVPIGVLLIGTLIFVLWRSERQMKALKTQIAQQERTNTHPSLQEQQHYEPVKVELPAH